MSRAGLGIDKEMFLTAQLYEEAKHFEFFARYFTEVFEVDGAVTATFLSAAPRAVLISDLEEVTERLRREDDPECLRATFVEAMTHYVGIVESMLARTGYVGAHDALATRGFLPGLQEGFRLIRRDEGRHVAFGMRCIAELTAEYPPYREVVTATLERHLPNVLATIGEFDYPHPIVDLGKLSAFALAQYEDESRTPLADSGRARAVHASAHEGHRSEGGDPSHAAHPIASLATHRGRAAIRRHDDGERVAHLARDARIDDDGICASRHLDAPAPGETRGGVSCRLLAQVTTELRSDSGLPDFRRRPNAGARGFACSLLFLSARRRDRWRHGLRDGGATRRGRIRWLRPCERIHRRRVRDCGRDSSRR